MAYECGREGREEEEETAVAAEEEEGGALWNADGGAGEGAGLFALSGRKERSQPEKGPARPERPSPRSGPPLSEGVAGPGGPASFGRSVVVSGRCGRPAAGLQGASAEAGRVAGRLSGAEAQPAGEETRASVSGRCTVCFGICEPGLDALGRQGAKTSFRCWAMQLKVLETGSPKSRCQQGCTPSRGSTGESAPCFFRFLVSAGIPRIPWLEATSLQYLPPSSQRPLLSTPAWLPRETREVIKCSKWMSLGTSAEVIYSLALMIGRFLLI
ncbi:collagen alpha-2(I) chain-like [Equus przewalskii]|uniref:Collagen alpha-2(I) chain-like n=2 Tax=Equus TaxID=9789 RepID=A0ABM4M315_EQUPR